MSSLPTTVLHVAATTAVVAATVTSNEPKWEDQTRNQRDLYTQFVISISLGLSAFIAFCILRPKWTALYAARRETRTAAFVLPELPDSLFGWVPVLYRITDEEVLASAGLDAYVKY
jgi:archaellum biogenesis protein FlaJ (TadC family)